MTLDKQILLDTLHELAQAKGLELLDLKITNYFRPGRLRSAADPSSHIRSAVRANTFVHSIKCEILMREWISLPLDFTILYNSKVVYTIAFHDLEQLISKVSIEEVYLGILTTLVV
jgi:hypothetical protein